MLIETISKLPSSSIFRSCAMACKLVRAESPTKTLSLTLRTSPPSMIAGGLMQYVSFRSFNTLATSTTSPARESRLKLQITALSPNTTAVSSTKQLSARALSLFIQMSFSPSSCRAPQYSACCLLARATSILSALVRTHRSYESGTGRTIACFTAGLLIEFITPFQHRAHTFCFKKPTDSMLFPRSPIPCAA